MYQIQLFETFRQLALQHDFVSVWLEAKVEGLTALSLFEHLQTQLSHGVVFETDVETEIGISLFAFNPLADCCIANENPVKNIDQSDILLTQLRTFEKKIKIGLEARFMAKVPHFFGAISYEAARQFECIPSRHSILPETPAVIFRCYQLVVRLDEKNQCLSCHYLVNRRGGELEDRYEEAKNNLVALANGFIVLSEEKDRLPISTVPLEERSFAWLTTTCDQDTEYLDMVDKAKRAIVAGEVFQVVLSRTFTERCHATPFQLYCAVRSVCPAPFIFYLSLGEKILIGASPERMLRVQEGRVTLNPIAGTRRRIGSERDDIIEQELLNCPKEVAEHCMLVDLARNDLGKICKPRSIVVSSFMKVKHYSSVSHMISTVEGELDASFDTYDALKATFPAGTLSGAPKIRAMQLIDELESTPRGFYGGMICFMDGKGYFDSCIAIRMLELDADTVHLRAGAGIVFDSTPAREEEETRIKSSALLRAVHCAKRE